VRKDNVVMTELRCVGAVPVLESYRETVKSIDRERKRRRRLSLTESERETVKRVDRERKRRGRASRPESQCVLQRTEGPILPLAERSLVGIARRPINDACVHRFAIGSMTLRCPHCNAVFFQSEQSSGSVSSPQFSWCCYKGRLTEVLKPL
jgi:hypothetical protein